MYFSVSRGCLSVVYLVLYFAYKVNYILDISVKKSDTLSKYTPQVLGILIN